MLEILCNYVCKAQYVEVSRFSLILTGLTTPHLFPPWLLFLNLSHLTNLRHYHLYISLLSSHTSSLYRGVTASGSTFVSGAKSSSHSHIGWGVDPPARSGSSSPIEAHSADILRNHRAFLVSFTKTLCWSRLISLTVVGYGLVYTAPLEPGSTL